MEIRIKTGTSLKCYYSDEESNVLVKICSDNDEAAQVTEWIGRKALEDALRLIDSIDGRVKVMTSSYAVIGPTVPQDVVSPVVPPKQTISVDPPQLVKQFEVAVRELAENPPKARDGEKDGLSEWHIKDLLKRFKASFQNPGSMYPPLSRHVGMNRDRFDTLISMI